MLQYKVFVHGPWGRLPIITGSIESLKEQIVKKLKVKEFTLYKNLEKTSVVDYLENKMQIYLSETNFKRTEVKANLCTHGKGEVCHHCQPSNILEDGKNDNISTNKVTPKFLSYASYEILVKDKKLSKDEFDYTCNPCATHGDKQRCVKCMPKVVTLMPQKFRYIDYVEFDDESTFKNFTNKWKESARQKIGILVGRRIKQKDQTVRAIISAIWVVDQESYPDGIHMSDTISYEFPFSKKNTQLRNLGIIYTDLHRVDGKLFSNKLNQNYIISAPELYFFYKIAQKLKINPVESLNICITLDSDRTTITPKNFMISRQFCKLIETNIIAVSSDPTAFIHKDREIRYNYKDDAGAVVSIKADPFVPIEYFITMSEVGFKNNPLFTSSMLIPSNASLKLVSGYFSGEYDDFNKYKNFSLLINLKYHHQVKLAEDIFSAVSSNDIQRFHTIIDSDEILKFFTKLEEVREIPWSCPACTFINQPLSKLCEICQGPKGTN